MRKMTSESQSQQQKRTHAQRQLRAPNPMREQDFYKGSQAQKETKKEHGQRLDCPFEDGKLKDYLGTKVWKLNGKSTYVDAGLRVGREKGGKQKRTIHPKDALDGWVRGGRGVLLLTFSRPREIWGERDRSSTPFSKTNGTGQAAVYWKRPWFEKNPDDYHLKFDRRVPDERWIGWKRFVRKFRVHKERIAQTW